MRSDHVLTINKLLWRLFGAEQRPLFPEALVKVVLFFTLVRLLKLIKKLN